MDSGIYRLRSKRKYLKHQKLGICFVIFGYLLGIPSSEAITRSIVIDAESSSTTDDLMSNPSTVIPLQRVSSTTKHIGISTTSGSGTNPSLKIATVTPIPSLSQQKEDKQGDLFLENSEDEEHLRQRIPTGLHPFDDEEEEMIHHHDPDDLRNDTRERDALQHEGTNHNPVIFVGGPGYLPPNNNNNRPRPVLEPDIPTWPSGSGTGPLANARFPYPLHSSPWDRNYRNPFNMTRVQHIEAECQDDFMKLRVSFNGSFQGLIYSSGFAYDNDCVYVNGTGRDYYEYMIRLNRCGTLGASNHVEGKKEPSKNFMWNTVTVQYNPMIEEEWDEHFKVTCEYGYDFWKTVTFKPFDVEVATGNPVLFTLTPPECYMEVRYGFGASGTRVGGPVRVGDPLTLMIYMRSQFDGFDLVVNDCYAHNGGSKRIQLIDHYGCPVDSKLMSPFRGTWSHTNVYETQVYAYLKTFRFTGSPALYIECDVRMCHGQCPSQPCYWRNVKNLQKRSLRDDSDRNNTLSESINLSQALTVLQDQDDTPSRATDPQDAVCLKTNIFTAIFALGLLILTILALITLIACFRLRRAKETNEETSDIIRPYTQTQQTKLPHSQQRHWATNPPLPSGRLP